MAQVEPLERLSVSPQARSSSCFSCCGDPFAPQLSVIALEGLDRTHMHVYIDVPMVVPPPLPPLPPLGPCRGVLLLPWPPGSGL